MVIRTQKLEVGQSVIGVVAIDVIHLDNGFTPDVLLIPSTLFAPVSSNFYEVLLDPAPGLLGASNPSDGNVSGQPKSDPLLGAERVSTVRSAVCGGPTDFRRADKAEVSLLLSPRRKMRVVVDG